MKILFIEDDPEAVTDAFELSVKSNWKPKILNFSEANEELQSFKPDVIILDLFKNSPGTMHENAGESSFKFIWEKRFCPVVIYSSDPDSLPDDEEIENHPFVKKVKKGKDSHKEVVSTIKSFENHVGALKETEAHFEQEMSTVLKKVAPNIFNFFEEPLRKDALTRACRRRLAASMDDYAAEGSFLANWEQYIFPVISKDLLLGDILFLKDSDHDKPENYFIILTPSCDLVNTAFRKPKVKNVLVAQCCSIEEGKNFSELLKTKDKEKLKKKLRLALTAGYFDSLFPLPALRNLLPHMFANLKSLKLIPFEEIGDERTNYIRKASVDSPFREMISWAYTQVAGRPGVPDRNFDLWIKEMMSLLLPSGSESE
ncbi:response regulator [Leptospira kmetyi]|uniref:Response regulator n=1 Tax=Leptospira kmetyi TaxID=408139 RepID=A0ABX4N4J1_9LEPT|nr:response regulator [Leptospira kmetyi]PJZ28318.1 hypothetical protein CH378_18530 [Leptospira kmetyi]